MIYNGLHTGWGPGGNDLGQVWNGLKHLTPAGRCHICRREDFFESQSLLDWIEEDISEAGEDEELAIMVRAWLNCEELGTQTYLGKIDVSKTKWYNDLTVAGEDAADVTKKIKYLKGKGWVPKGFDRKNYGPVYISAPSPISEMKAEKCKG
jgi:hypothetical protein